MRLLGDVGRLAVRHLRAERIGAQERRLRDDPRFAEEMAYCAPRGIRHSRFLDWDPDDQDKALAWQRLRAAACPSCGTFVDEWVDPETGRIVAEQPYVAEAVRCYGCAERDAVAGEIRKAGGDLDGVRVRLRPFDPERDDEED